MVTIPRRPLTALELHQVFRAPALGRDQIATLLAPPARPSAEELSRKRFFPRGGR